MTSHLSQMSYTSTSPPASDVLGETDDLTSLPTTTDAGWVKDTFIFFVVLRCSVDFSRIWLRSDYRSHVSKHCILNYTNLLSYLDLVPLGALGDEKSPSASKHITCFM